MNPQTEDGQSAVRTPDVDASSGGQDWLTYKQAALLTGKSDRTLRRAVADRRVSTRPGPGTSAWLSGADLTTLGWLRAPEGGRSARASLHELAELVDLRREAQAMAVELGELRGRLAERDGFLRTLTDQVAEKDRQLSRLHATVQALVGAAGRTA